MIIVVHGGAGTVPKKRRDIANNGVLKAIDIGWSKLKIGSSAIDAVEAAVVSMENNSAFNAGLGSVLTEEGTIEMDAMIMNGKDLQVGGVIGVSKIKNPIILSRKIMENSRHILFTRDGAEKFAENIGMELIDQQELVTERVKTRLANYFKKQELDKFDPEGRDKYGTVGAVALDDKGYLASATSTGGVLGKKVGRVGDTPMIGAGTYADEELAVSSTGVGEFIMRGMLGYRIKGLLQSNNIQVATNIALQQMKELINGQAGVIAIDKNGNWVAEKTTKDLIYAVRNF